MKILTCLFLSLSSMCFAQQFTYNQGGTEAKNYYEEIPYDNLNGKLILEGEIAGKKHRFLFDTGAPCAISKELAAELNAKVIHKDIVTDAYLHSDSATIVELNGLKLGGITFNQIPTLTLFPDFYKCYHIDGVIGSNLLRKSIVSIVDAKHMIILTDQESKLKLNRKNSVPMISKEGPQSDPQIRILMKNSLKLTIPFDTGDNDFLRISDAAVTGLKQYGVLDTLDKGYGANNMSLMGIQATANNYRYKVATFTVGNGLFNNLIVESNKDAIPAMGAKLLNYGTVTLDFINDRFYFDANKTLNDLGEKQWPVQPSFVDNKYIIGVVWQKANGLMKLGEQILAVNGVDYSHVSMCDLITMKPQMSLKETVILTLKDAQGKTRNVTMKKE
jgi:hypothetical protein